MSLRTVLVDQPTSLRALPDLRRSKRGPLPEEEELDRDHRDCLEVRSYAIRRKSTKYYNAPATRLEAVSMLRDIDAAGPRSAPRPGTPRSHQQSSVAESAAKFDSLSVSQVDHPQWRDTSLDVTLPMFAVFEEEEDTPSGREPDSIGRVLAMCPPVDAPPPPQPTDTERPRALRLNITRGVTDIDATAPEEDRPPLPPRASSRPPVPAPRPLPLDGQAHSGASMASSSAAEGGEEKTMLGRGKTRLRRLVQVGRRRNRATQDGSGKFHENASDASDLGSMVSDSLLVVSAQKKRGRARHKSRMARLSSGAPGVLGGILSPPATAKLTIALPDVEQPDCTPMPFGTEWSADLFTGLHNGIRKEIAELYQILDAMVSAQGRALAANWVTFSTGFFAWFEVFHWTVVEIIRVEETVIFPWLESAVSLAEPLDRETRGRFCQEALQKLRAVDDLRSDFAAQSDDDIFIRVFAHIEKAVELLLTNMKRIDMEVPVHVEMFYQESHKREMDVAIRSELIKGSVPQFAIPIIVRGIEDSATRRKWVETNMRGPRRIMLSLWSQACENQHYRIASKLIGLGAGL